jgi:hypothetical protein
MFSFLIILFNILSSKFKIWMTKIHFLFHLFDLVAEFSFVELEFSGYWTTSKYASYHLLSMKNVFQVLDQRWVLLFWRLICSLDNVREIVNALRRRGLHVGLYFSLFEWFNPLYLGIFFLLPFLLLIFDLNLEFCLIRIVFWLSFIRIVFCSLKDRLFICFWFDWLIDSLICFFVADKRMNGTTQIYVNTTVLPQLFDIVNTFQPELIFSDGTQYIIIWNNCELISLRLPLLKSFERFEYLSFSDFHSFILFGQVIGKWLQNIGK